MSQRRQHSTFKPGDCKREPARHQELSSADSQDTPDRQGALEPHTHSHSLFGHTHSNGEAHSHGPEQIVAILEGRGDRGSRITLIGLVCNVSLTTAKGFAGWWLHSASLLADAGHSLSDLLGDFVTLVSWRLSKKPPSERYPYGYGKIETVGTTIISTLLIGGGLGIGFHSYYLLLSALDASASALSPGPAQDLLFNITSIAHDVPFVHVHGPVESVDPNAAWFAAISVAMKEWLYRITKVVADEEKSPVLLANAVHHRSDAYSSLVAFFAIMGTWLFPAIPLDPIGGLVVSVIIFRQGLHLFYGAAADLTDAGVSSETRRSLEHAVKHLTLEGPFASQSLSIEHLRARRSGSQLFVNLTVIVPGSATIQDTSLLDEKIIRTLKEARKGIAEVQVKYIPAYCKSS